MKIEIKRFNCEDLEDLKRVFESIFEELSGNINPENTENKAGQATEKEDRDAELQEEITRLYACSYVNIWHELCATTKSNLDINTLDIMSYYPPLKADMIARYLATKYNSIRDELDDVKDPLMYTIDFINYKVVSLNSELMAPDLFTRYYVNLPIFSEYLDAKNTLEKLKPLLTTIEQYYKPCKKTIK
jgi:hypothetical protein